MFFIWTFNHDVSLFDLSYALPSPKNLALTSLPFNPAARIVWGSPGTRSTAWSNHLTSSPFTSRTMPLIGLRAERVIVSPSLSIVVLRPTSLTDGNLINLNGSGLVSKSISSQVAENHAKATIPVGVSTQNFARSSQESRREYNGPWYIAVLRPYGKPWCRAFVNLCARIGR